LNPSFKSVPIAIATLFGVPCFSEEVSGDAAYSGDYDHYCFNFGGWIHLMGGQIY